MGGGEGKRNECKMLVGEPKGRGAFGRYLPRQEDNIKIDLNEMEHKSVD
jgi:hypothetical protein